MNQESYALPDDTSVHSNAVPGADDTLVIEVNPAIRTVIERFDVSAGKQDDAIASAMKQISNWMQSADFRGVLLLRGRQPDGLTVYSQWDWEPRKELPEKPSNDSSMAQTLVDFELLASENFAVSYTGQAPNMDLATKMVPAETPLAHFGMFSVAEKDQEEMVRRGQTFGPNSFILQGLHSINFHKGAGGCFVVNLGFWSSFDHFVKIHDADGFDDKAEFFRDIADFKPDFFDVVAVKTRASPNGQFGNQE